MSGPDPRQTLAGVGEDELLARIFPHLPGGRRACSLGPGDDAAVVAAPGRSVRRHDRRHGAAAGTGATSGPPAPTSAPRSWRRTSPTSPRWAAVPTGAAGHPGRRPGDERWPGCEDFAGAWARRRRRPGVAGGRRRPVLGAGGVAGRVGHRARGPRRAGPRCCARARGPATSSPSPAALGRSAAGLRCCCSAAPGRPRTRRLVDYAPPARRPTSPPGRRPRRPGPPRCSTSATACCATRGRIARASGVGHRPRPRRCIAADVAALRRGAGRGGGPPSACSAGGEEHALLATLPGRPRCRRAGGRSGRSCAGAGVRSSTVRRRGRRRLGPLRRLSRGPRRQRSGTAPPGRTSPGDGEADLREGGRLRDAGQSGARQRMTLPALRHEVQTLSASGSRPRTDQSLDALDVGVPATLGAAVRVRDVVTEARSLAADVAVGSHG